jgi:hypothetical protein
MASILAADDQTVMRGLVSAILSAGCKNPLNQSGHSRPSMLT